MFDKEGFINSNSAFLYNKLLDFLDCEINKCNFAKIILIISCKNITSFEFEGNQYLIRKKSNESKVLIIDTVSEENGVAEYQSRFSIELNDLVTLVYDKAKENNWQYLIS